VSEESIKKRRARRVKAVEEEVIPPRPSYWPFALAVAVMIMLLGIVIHPIMLGIGVVLAAAAVIGLGLEHR
jgi:hypothetical protein